MINEHHPLFSTYRLAKRIAIAIVGGTVLIIGVAMIVLPGPAFVVIPVGLGILGIEFAWARRWLRRIKEGGETFLGRFRKQKEAPAETGREQK